MRKLNYAALFLLIRILSVSCQFNNNTSDIEKIGMPVSIANTNLGDVAVVSKESNSRSIISSGTNRNLYTITNDILTPIFYETSKGNLVTMNISYYHAIPGFFLCTFDSLIEYPDSVLDATEGTDEIEPSRTSWVQKTVLIDFSTKKVYDISDICSFIGYGPYGSMVLYDDDYIYLKTDSSDMLYRISKSNPTQAVPLNNKNTHPIGDFIIDAGDRIISFNMDLHYDNKGIYAYSKKGGDDIPLDATALTENIFDEAREITYRLYGDYNSRPYMPAYQSRDGKQWLLATQMGIDYHLAVVNPEYYQEGMEYKVKVNEDKTLSVFDSRQDWEFSCYSEDGADVVPPMDYVWVTSDTVYTDFIENMSSAGSNVFFYKDGYIIIEDTPDGKSVDARFVPVSYPADMDFSVVASGYAYYRSGNNVVRTNIFSGMTETVVSDSSNLFKWTVSGNTMSLIRLTSATGYESTMIDLGEKPFTEKFVSSEQMSIVELPELSF